MQDNTIPQPIPPTQATPPQAPVTPSTTKKEGWKNIASTLAILLAAPLIALFLTSFIFQSYEVDGPSMQQTLHDNDRLIVMKIGKTWSKITHKHYIPKRGEIVVFHKKGLYSYNQDLDKQLIKRVIALPGERVLVNNGILLVFNAEHPEGYQPDLGTEYVKNITTTAGNVDVTLGDGQIFVSGDNRTNSFDSRDFGPIDSSDIVGTLALRVFPLGQFESF